MPMGPKRGPFLFLGRTLPNVWTKKEPAVPALLNKWPRLATPLDRRATALGRLPAQLACNLELEPLGNHGFHPLNLFAKAQGRGELARFDELFQGALAAAKHLGDLFLGDEANF